MKKILFKIFSILPEGYLKNQIKCYYFNFFNRKEDFRSYYKKNYFQFIFQNGIVIKSYYKMCGDLKGPLKGYLHKYIPKEGEIIIDCGAYGGSFTIYAAKLVGDRGKIIAFEPDLDNYKLLIRNIKLNNLQNIIALNKGVWNENSYLLFDNRGTESSFFFVDDNGDKNKIKVAVVTLDDELKKMGISKIDFIKMDIEGAEIEALEGAEKILRDNNVKLAIASYHIRDNKPTSLVVEKILKNFGYKTETSFPGHLTTYAQKQ